ncbi:hypothetical protein AN1V17_50710 [Vallitalea sediminicola]
MGTWGIGVTENDSAMDIIYEIEDEKDLAIIIRKLIQIINLNDNGEYIDFDLATESLVVIEIVTVLLQGVSENLTPQLNKWLLKKTHGDKNIISIMNEIMDLLNLMDTPLFEDSEDTWLTATYNQKWNYCLLYLQTISFEAIEIVLNNSELMELWKESEKYDEWIKNVEEIKRRLNSKE